MTPRSSPLSDGGRSASRVMRGGPLPPLCGARVPRWGFLPELLLGYAAPSGSAATRQGPLTRALSGSKKLDRGPGHPLPSAREAR